jgi:hypothetical protein
VVSTKPGEVHTTEDGVSHILTVTDLNEQAITGDLERTVTPDAWTDGQEQKPAEGSDIEATSIEIQIDQIREVAEEEHDAVKTGVLAGGLAAFAYLLFLAAAIAASAATLSGGFWRTAKNLMIDISEGDGVLQTRLHNAENKFHPLAWLALSLYTCKCNSHTRSMPYEDVENIRPESKKMVETWLEIYGDAKDVVLGVEAAGN